MENLETNEDRSQDDVHPEVGPSVCQSCHSVDSESDEAHHMVTGVLEEIPYCSLELPQENKRRRAPQVSHNFAVRTLLRQLKQTRFCWLLSIWRATAFPPTSTTTFTEFQNCLNPLRQQGPHST